MSSGASPTIRAFRLEDGGADGTIAVPEILRGRRANRGLEALALDPDGRHLWTANEEALAADGPAAGAGEGTVVRLVRLPVAGRGEAFQAAYRADPPHRHRPAV